jgi:hypothetical protein
MKMARIWQVGVCGLKWRLKGVMLVMELAAPLGCDFRPDIVIKSKFITAVGSNINQAVNMQNRHTKALLYVLCDCEICYMDTAIYYSRMDLNSSGIFTVPPTTRTEHPASA